MEVTPTSLGMTYTVSAWVKAESLPANSEIYTQRSATPVKFQLDTLNRDARFIVRDDAGVSAAASYSSGLLIGAWYHVAGVRNGNTVSVYVNDVQGTNGSATFGTVSTGGNEKTGVLANDDSLPFNGLIDDVRVYNRILSATEIKRLYNMGR